MSRGRACRSGQSSTELLLTLAFLILPCTMISSIWIKTEWMKGIATFRQFQSARYQLLTERRKVMVDGIILLPLEDLDHDKGGLEVDDLLREVSSLWEQLSSS